MSLPIPAGTFALDPAHSQADFAITHLGISMIRGRFNSIEGSLTVGEDLGGTAVNVAVEMGSLDSGNEGRDGHMQGEEFFDAGNHPTMTFASTGIEASGDGYTMTGDLTIKGVTQSVALHAKFNGEAVFPMDGSTHYGFAASGAISRSEFNMDAFIPMLSDQVELSLQAQFISPVAD